MSVATEPASAAPATVAAAVVRPAGRRRSRRVIASLACFAIGATYLVPLLWIASLAVRDESDAASLALIPNSFRLANFSDAFEQFGLGTLFSHSLFIVAGTVVLALAMSVLAAYGFSVWRTRLTEGMFLFILLGLVVPPAAMIVPFFLAMQNLGLYNNLYAVILGEAAFALPLGVLILRGYVDRIPHELTAAARVDGATPWRAFRHVVLPLLKPPIVTVALFMTLFTWNDFLIPLVLLPFPEESTITVGLAQSVGQYGDMNLGLVSAAAVLALLPLLTVFIAARRFYVQGLTAGSVK